MQDFRNLAKHFISKAAELCDELMFDLKPEIDLSRVKDDIANTQSRFSFVQHPHNKLEDAYFELSAKACETRRNGLFRDRRWD
jgi:hypothetical protein